MCYASLSLGHCNTTTPALLKQDRCKVVSAWLSSCLGDLCSSSLHSEVASFVKAKMQCVCYSARVASFQVYASRSDVRNIFFCYHRFFVKFWANAGHDISRYYRYDCTRTYCLVSLFYPSAPCKSPVRGRLRSIFALFTLDIIR